jgi:NitT/TauT family transport system ATP-binding protein
MSPAPPEAAVSEAHGPVAVGEPMIRIGGLDKTYETNDGPLEALRGVDLDVRPGEFVSLVGPSGCGKSTLLHCIAGLVPFDAGTLTVAGSPARAGRVDIGIMLQSPVLFPWRTVINNVLLPAEVLKLDREKARVRAIELLETVGLAGFERKHTWELSGGMRQRASLVQALVADPPVLLMDEPFSAVDEFTRERLNGELASLHETLNRTTVYVTHNMHEAVFLADRIVAMKSRPGEVVEIIDVDLPRPRRLSMQDDPRHAELVTRVRSVLAPDLDGSRR